MMKKFSLIFELCNCSNGDLADNDALEEKFMRMLTGSGFTPVSSQKKEFTPHGLTLAAILTESHALLHSWPEESRLSIDIYTCSDPAKLESFIGMALEEFNPGKYFFKVIDRNKIVDL
ncbi:MAG: adenosylmethionine decarboxylase [Ignavibacteriaceae bacterium]|nr:MAG: hypothetical protein EDM75_15310 [Chlorobiota bacterium]GJQ33393.1 MAG: adenosylmethionine decarboxylase [Ignavibacteriaceae bacterium]